MGTAFRVDGLPPEELARRLGIEPPQMQKPKPGQLDVTAARTPQEALVLLNALPLWEGRLQWAAFKRRGSTLLGITQDGEVVHFDITKLTRFAHAQTVILSTLGIGIRAPRRGQIGSSWLIAAELMVRAAAIDAVDAGRPEDDLRADIVRCFRQAGEPRIQDRKELVGLLQALLSYRRAPNAEVAPAAVFLYATRAWLYPPVLREWLSTPVGGHRFLSLPLLREHAALLGFEPRELDLRDLAQGVRAVVWAGPVEVLNE